MLPDPIRIGKAILMRKNISDKEEYKYRPTNIDVFITKIRV